jgi:hypothetical protein
LLFFKSGAQCAAFYQNIKKEEIMENLKANIKKLGKNKLYLILIGLAVILLATVLIYAYVEFLSDKISVIPTEEGKPYCGAIGSRSEGWYSSIDGLIKYDNCEGCVAVCGYVGTRSEGWYVSGNCDSGLNLIKYDNCSMAGAECKTDEDCRGVKCPGVYCDNGKCVCPPGGVPPEEGCYSDSDCHGITIPIGKEVYTVETTFDVIPVMIQALRDGHHAEAEKISNSELRITVEGKEIEFIKQYEWVKKITKRSSQFCEFPEGECKGPGKCVNKLINGGCAAIWTPVCGCDGKTYSNDCSRNMADVSKKHDGECKQEKQTCDEKCKSLNYKSGICRTWVVLPDAEEGCKENEKDIGETSDCTTLITTLNGIELRTLGVDKTCCCKIECNEKLNKEDCELVGGEYISYPCPISYPCDPKYYCKCPCITDSDCGVDRCDQGRDVCHELKYKCENGKCDYTSKEYKGYSCARYYDPTSATPEKCLDTCGDGVCKSPETKWWCPEDCKEETDCIGEGGIYKEWTGTIKGECCEGLHVIASGYRNNISYCTSEVCGNGECKELENKWNCPEDCGTAPDCRNENYGCTIDPIPCCPGLKSSALFGDPNGDCGEMANCGTICIPCGNGICDANESKCNCPEDCKEETDCIPEGSSVDTSGMQKCCAGLKAISCARPNSQGECHNEDFNCDSFPCANCGNGICGLGENKCNCPEDCKKGNECDTSWYYIFQGDSGYNNTYNDLTVPEKSFIGVVAFKSCSSPGVGTSLMRCNPYKLNGVSVYTGSKNLKKYEGQKVEIIGKKHSFELEGQQLEEIWPIKIRCKEGETLSADLNCDGKVNLTDSAILLSFWNKDPSEATSCKTPDINQDGSVNLADFSIIMSQWTK